MNQEAIGNIMDNHANSSINSKAPSIINFVKNPVFLIGILLLLVFVSFKLSSSNNIYAFHADTMLANSEIAGVPVDGLSAQQITDLIDGLLSVTKVDLKFEDLLLKTSAANLGLSVDSARLKLILTNQGLENYVNPKFKPSKYDLPLKIDYKKTDAAFTEFMQEGYKPAVNATLSVEDDQIVATEGVEGHGINARGEVEQVKNVISHNLGVISQQVQPTIILPSITKADILFLETKLNDIIFNDYSINLGSNITHVSKAEVASWLELQRTDRANIIIAVNKDLINKYVRQLADLEQRVPVNEVITSYQSGRAPEVTTIGKNGQTVKNVDLVAEELYQKVTSKESGLFVFNFVDIPFKKVARSINDTGIRGSYTYSVAVWGNVSSDLNQFKALAAETLASANGWRASGVVFQEVPSGGNFTLILSEPARVAGASSGCSANWSCRAGRNVIINERNWAGATPSWNAAGGSIRDYRHMVINHEVGHLIGFGHRNCSGLGQLAPIMQQQSISLQGCKFNPWPTQSELSR